MQRNIPQCRYVCVSCCIVHPLASSLLAVFESLLTACGFDGIQPHGIICNTIGLYAIKPIHGHLLSHIYIYTHTHTHRVVCHQIHTWSFIIIIYNTMGLYAIKSSQSFIIIYNTIGLYAIKSTHYLWLHLTVAFVFFGGIKPYGINMYVFRCIHQWALCSSMAYIFKSPTALT